MTKLIADGFKNLRWLRLFLGGLLVVGNRKRARFCNPKQVILTVACTFSPTTGCWGLSA